MASDCATAPDGERNLSGETNSEGATTMQATDSNDVASLRDTNLPKLSAPGMSQKLPRKKNVSTRKKRKETIVLSDSSSSALSSPKANENICSNSAKNKWNCNEDADSNDNCGDSNQIFNISLIDDEEVESSNKETEVMHVSQDSNNASQESYQVSTKLLSSHLSSRMSSQVSEASNQESDQESDQLWPLTTSQGTIVSSKVSSGGTRIA